jgi:hypothetical protein
MKKMIMAWLIFAVLFIGGAACAQEKITAEVDKLKLATDDELTYKLNIVSDKTNTAFPKIPDFKGFRVISQAQSTTVSFQKDRPDVLMTYVYILVPSAPGKFTIGPSSVRIAGKDYSSRSFDIEVTQGKNPPNPVPEDNSDEEHPKTTL